MRTEEEVLVDGEDLTGRQVMMIHDARAPEKTMLYLPTVVPS
jgi:hypothetical protein